jgi:hypothetical protein
VIHAASVDMGVSELVVVYWACRKSFSRDAEKQNFVMFLFPRFYRTAFPTPTDLKYIVSDICIHPREPVPASASCAATVATPIEGKTGALDLAASPSGTGLQNDKLNCIFQYMTEPRVCPPSSQIS